MKPQTPNFPRTRRGRPSGFTLVELLVVIAIVAVMAVIVVMGVGRFVENGRKVKTLAQFRDFQVGMTLFETDHKRPPIPQSKRDTGWDTIYGDPGGTYSNDFLIAALAGEDKDYPFSGENFSTTYVNPRKENYITFPYSPNKKGGVGDDGRLYDPWGGEIMVAINGFAAPGQRMTDFSSTEPGRNDRRLHTWGLAEYTETKPGEQAYVFWSYGKDGRKGKGAANNQDVVPLGGSDDVISW